MRGPFNTVPMLAFLIIGLSLNVAGIGLAVSALWQEWGEHGRGDFLPWLATAWRRVTRRRVHHVGEAHLGVGVGITAWVGTATGHAPDADLSVDQRVDRLRHDVDALTAQLRAQDSRQAQAVGKVTEAVNEARAEAQSGISDVREMARMVAVGTLRRQMFGLVLIGLGSLVSVLPALLGWA